MTHQSGRQKGLALLQRKIGSAFRRLDIVKRPIPHGLFSMSILFNQSDPRIRLHRRANFAMRHPWPLPLWICIQAILALRWRFLFSGTEANRIVDHFGPSVEASEGLPLAEQRKRTLALSRRYCIPPEAIYRFRLYRDPAHALDYVYGTENMGIHLVRNGSNHEADKDALHDKCLFEARARAAGLPAVQILACLPKGEPTSHVEVAALGPRGVFAKHRSGFYGQGAFSLRFEDARLSAQMLDGRRLESGAAVDAALNALLATGDVLIQPLLECHPALMRAATSQNPAVLRVTTRRRSHGVDVVVAFARIPQSVQYADGRTGILDVVAPVDPESGRLVRNPNSYLSLHRETAMLEKQAFEKLGEHATVPFWPEILHHSRLAQKEFNHLWSIGWDWIVTPAGPQLLEGNTHWEMMRPQEVTEGLLSTVLAKE